MLNRNCYKRVLLSGFMSLPAVSQAIAQTITSTVTTAAATTFCSNSQRTYPKQTIWGTSATATATNAVVSPSGAPAVSPLITQIRNGQVIATYTTFGSNPSTCTYIGNGTDWQTPSVAANTGCGPFTTGHNLRLWAPGDVFQVAPAIYTGVLNQPYFGPAYDGYSSTSPTAMSNITIQGMVQSGYRPVIYYNPSQTDLQGYANFSNTLGHGPVYFDASTNVTWDSIDVFAGPGAMSYLALGTDPSQPPPNANNTFDAAVYDVGASNLTFSHSRISGFDVVNYNYYAYEKANNPTYTVYAGANGFLGAGNYSGTTTFLEDEFDHDGGFISNYAHNVYMQESYVDPNFEVIAELNYSHDAWQGHLFKSRAQQNDFESNYFQGGLPQAGLVPAVAETLLLDIPNGGVLIAHGNIFAKNASGPNSNGVSIEYGSDGVNTTPNLPTPSIDIEHNSFKTFAATYDGTNIIYPFVFYNPYNPRNSNPPVVPGTPSFPSNTPVTIQGNLFGGYCPSGQPTPNSVDYRGDLSAIAAPTEVSANFVGPGYTYAGRDPRAGNPKYSHVTNTTQNFTISNHVGGEN